MPPLSIAFLLLLLPQPAAAAEPQPVALLTIEGAIGPASADYFHRGLEKASEQGAQLVILKMDTPGGLDVSMRSIIKDILAAPIPVAAFVAPSGARAASAGTYILYASHIAAMAPATNLGAATPVSIGGGPGPGKSGPEKKEDGSDTLAHKQVQDAAAYIRGLAQLRGRNQEWAERAVREAVSLSAEEALKMGVVDLIADDVPQLLKKIDRRKLNVQGKELALNTANAPVNALEPDWRAKVLAVITDPSIAYLMLLLGFYGLFFEFSNPGYLLPGVAGLIFLVLALYALQLLPVNYAGLALIVLGLGFMVAEVYFPAYGSLGIGGVVAFVIGSVILIHTDAPGFGIPLALILGIGAASAAFVVLIAGMAVKAHRRPVVSGREELVGCQGEVMEDFERDGWARVRSENWRVRYQGQMQRGQKIRVVKIHGLTLEVLPESPQPNEEEKPL